MNKLHPNPSPETANASPIIEDGLASALALDGLHQSINLLRDIYKRAWDPGSSADTRKFIGDIIPSMQTGVVNAQDTYRQTVLQEEHATIDQLTGLNNQNSFTPTLINKLNESARRNSSLTLMIIDLDGFKPVNDTYGHQAGDLVLSHVGSSIKDSIRGYEVAHRIGGDEFALLLPDISKKDSAVKAARISENVAREVVLPDGRKVSVDSSIGVNYLSPDEVKRVASELNILIASKKELDPNDEVLNKKVDKQIKALLDEIKAPADARMYETKKDKGASR